MRVWSTGRGRAELPRPLWELRPSTGQPSALECICTTGIPQLPMAGRPWPGPGVRSEAMGEAMWE